MITIVKGRGGEGVVVTAGLSWEKIIDEGEEVGGTKLEYKKKEKKYKVNH